jgi:hypothetical protein
MPKWDTLKKYDGQCRVEKNMQNEKKRREWYVD